MSTSSAASIQLRCTTCGAAARSGAVYCPQCGTSLSATSPAAPAAAQKNRSKRRFPWFTILIATSFFGVFHARHQVALRATSSVIESPDVAMQSLPQDALQAIQPSQDFQFTNGDIGLNVYNGSQWTIRSIDLEIELNHGPHTVRQTYRTTIASGQLAPLSSEYVTVHSALRHIQDGSGLSFRVVSASGNMTR